MEDNREEVALQILFNFKNSCDQTPFSLTNSAQNTPILGNRSFRSLSCSSPSIGLGSGSSSEFDFVPSSPSKILLPNSLNNSNSGVPNESPLPPIPIFGMNGSSSSKNSLIPSSPLSFSIGESANNTNGSSPLSNATSLLGSSSENAFQQSSLSSSPSHSVPSSPPTFTKSVKKQIQNKNLSPSTSYTNLLSSSPSVSLQNAFVQNCNISSPNLNNSLSPISISCNNNQNNPLFQNVSCNLEECLLCIRGQPEVLVKSPTWASIMRVVFYTLHNEMQDKEFFSLKTDVYDFMTGHWDVLCLNKKKSDNWHKQIQDMLSHSKNIFESGMEKYKQNGFWRLKQNTDPWILPQKGARKNSTSSAQSSPLLNLTPMSPSSSNNNLVLNSPLMLSSPTKQRLFSEDFNIGGTRKRSLSALELTVAPYIQTSPNMESIQMDTDIRKKRNSSSEYSSVNSSVNNSPKMSNLIVLGSSSSKLIPPPPSSPITTKIRSHSVTTTTITPLSRSITSFRAICDEEDDELYIDDEN